MPPSWAKDTKLYRLATEEARVKHRANVLKDGTRYWKVVKKIYDRLAREAEVTSDNAPAPETKVGTVAAYVVETNDGDEVELYSPKVPEGNVVDPTILTVDEVISMYKTSDVAQILMFGSWDDSVSDGETINVLVVSDDMAKLVAPTMDSVVWLIRDGASLDAVYDVGDSVFRLDDHSAVVERSYKATPPFGMVIYHWLVNILNVEVSRIVGEEFHYTLKEPDGTKISKAKRRLCQDYKTLVNKG